MLVDILTYLMENGSEVIAALLATKVLADLIVNFTPTPADDNLVGKVYKVIEWVGGIWTDAAKQFPDEANKVIK